MLKLAMSINIFGKYLINKKTKKDDKYLINKKT
jgi:hypothetical protein